MATADETCNAIVNAVEITRTDDPDTYITYSTILDVHLVNAARLSGADQNIILRRLAALLNAEENANLTEAIGWDVVAMMVPFLGRKATSETAQEVLDVVVNKGNAKEVFLKCVEGIRNILWQREELEEEELDDLHLPEDSEVTPEDGPDPVMQLIKLHDAAKEVFGRIRTARPSRFLTTFGAALLTAVTNAYRAIIDSPQLEILHDLMLEFIVYYSDSYGGTSDEGKEIERILQGVVTTYVSIFLGNQLLYWSGRYWEESNPIPFRRIRSKDLVTEELDLGFVKLRVVAEGTHINLYEHLLPTPPPSNIEPESVYPEGDSYIPVDPVGALLLLIDSWTRNPDHFKDISEKTKSSDLLSVHMELVDNHLENAILNVVDAITSFGLHLLTVLSSTDIPDLTNPDSPAATEFFSYLQKLAAASATCPSENLRPLIYALVEGLLDKCPPEGRLYYILDTIEHCPFENLRAAAVGSLKKQIVNAKSGTLFASPLLLGEVQGRVFRLPEDVLADPDVAMENATFIIESLSLYRFLLLQKEDTIKVQTAAHKGEMYRTWLTPLRTSVEGWVKASTPSQDEGEELTWRIVIENLDRIDEAARKTSNVVQ